jgi:hypothetical protein
VRKSLLIFFSFATLLCLFALFLLPRPAEPGGATTRFSDIGQWVAGGPSARSTEVGESLSPHCEDADGRHGVWIVLYFGDNGYEYGSVMEDGKLKNWKLLPGGRMGAERRTFYAPTRIVAGMDVHMPPETVPDLDESEKKISQLIRYVTFGDGPAAGAVYRYSNSEAFGEHLAAGGGESSWIYWPGLLYNIGKTTAIVGMLVFGAVAVGLSLPILRSREFLEVA